MKLDVAYIKLRQVLHKLKIIDFSEYYQKNRIIFINNTIPNDYLGEKPLEYGDNQMLTSKYTLWNFVPKNLFEQFRRVANLYFLITIIIRFTLPDPPTNPIAATIPLGLVIVVTAIKQGYEDILRHISDNKVNNKIAYVLRNGSVQECKWRDIRCGDIIRVNRDEPFPCDLLLLYSESDSNTCHITTTDLDGETNLKTRCESQSDIFLEFNSTEPHLALQRLSGVIVCDKPNSKLYDFKGQLLIKKTKIKLTNENILLKGSYLKITQFIYGCVIYTGKQTKMMLNSKFKSNKMSCVERKLNSFIILYLILLATLTTISFGLTFQYQNIYKKHWYISGREPNYFYDNPSLYNFIILIFYLTKYSSLIPLSMYITMETLKFFNTKFFEWDECMYDAERDLPAKANSSDLNEDLGQVEYLFSDKTGTLTKNEMIFKQCFIDGYIYEEKSGQLYNKTLDQVTLSLDNTSQELNKFFEILTLCHTIQVNHTFKEKFQAPSPDEFSFIKFCENIGIVYEGEKRTASQIVREVNYFNKFNRQYKILHLFEFDSTRKRMSVMVERMDTNEIYLFCKGAEMSIFEKCIKGDTKKCDQAIGKFAQLGLRTLALAYRQLTKTQVGNFEKLLAYAQNELITSDKVMSDIIDEIESELTLVGATAIEDKLQDECAETLEALREGGIKVWVLTGDKTETAINISKSCRHLTNDMIECDLANCESEKTLEWNIDCFRQKISHLVLKKSFSLVIDGKSISLILDKNYLREKFIEICLKCDAVLCCRMSPAQKAEIVHLVKESQRQPMTAAIGDGANDVSMLQEAHIGIGIYGKEGNMAALSADFAFSKFKYLRRAFFVHGFLYYTRVAILVQYFFYKNLAFIICTFFYTYFSAFSVKSLFNPLYLNLYNIIYSSITIIFHNLFEQRYSIDKLASNPKLYRTIARKSQMTIMSFVKWSLLGTWHAVVCFFFVYFLNYKCHSSYDGTLSDHTSFGLQVATLITIVVHLKLILEWHHWCPMFIIGNLTSILVCVAINILPNAIIVPKFLQFATDGQNFYWIFFDMLSNPSTWLLFLLATCVSILPDLCLKAVENNTFWLKKTITPLDKPVM